MNLESARIYLFTHMPWPVLKLNFKLSSMYVTTYNRRLQHGILCVVGFKSMDIVHPNWGKYKTVLKSNAKKKDEFIPCSITSRLLLKTKWEEYSYHEIQKSTCNLVLNCGSPTIALGTA